MDRRKFLLAASATLLASCWKRSSLPKAAKVTVAQFADLAFYMPLYVAQDLGFFQELGLDVSIVSTGGDDKTFAAVISGQAQFGVADPTFPALAATNGADGVLLGLLVNGMPNYIVGPSTKQTAQDFSFLEGKSIGTPPAPSTAHAVIKHVLDTKKISAKIVQMAPSALLGALEARTVDYAVLIEPWVSQYSRLNQGAVFSLDSVFPEFALTGISASRRYVVEHPEESERFIAALDRAVDLCRNPVEFDKVVGVAQRRFPNEDPRDLRASVVRHAAYFPKCLAFSETAWDAAVGMRRNLGDFEDITADQLKLARHLEPKFATQACPR